MMEGLHGPPDPRPLTGEPLALDLIDTVWIDDAGRHDLLADPAARTAWLARHGLPDAGQAAADPLVQAREALRALLERRNDPAAERGVDDVLARGGLQLTVRGESAHVPDAWAAAWRAARDLRRLLAERPDRVKRCANPDCVLWFEDTTRSGTRRWCSMTGGCGSRLKARRHAKRARTP